MNKNKRTIEPNSINAMLFDLSVWNVKIGDEIVKNNKKIYKIWTLYANKINKNIFPGESFQLKKDCKNYFDEWKNLSKKFQNF